MAERRDGIPLEDETWRQIIEAAGLGRRRAVRGDDPRGRLAAPNVPVQTRGFAISYHLYSPGGSHDETFSPTWRRLRALVAGHEAAPTPVIDLTGREGAAGGLRAGLLLLVALGVLGTALALAYERHWQSAWQLAPWVDAGALSASPGSPSSFARRRRRSGWRGAGGDRGHRQRRPRGSGSTSTRISARTTAADQHSRSAGADRKRQPRALPRRGADGERRPSRRRRGADIQRHEPHGCDDRLRRPRAGARGSVARAGRAGAGPGDDRPRRHARAVAGLACEAAASGLVSRATAGSRRSGWSGTGRPCPSSSAMTRSRASGARPAYQRPSG